MVSAESDWTVVNSLEGLNGWTKSFSEALSARLGKGQGVEVALCGELGAGKTTLVRLCARHLGVIEPVSSPSYVLQHEYRLPGKGKVEHWDLYRIPDLPLELIEPVPAGAVRLIEWADKVDELMQRADIVVKMRRPPDLGDTERREILLTYRGG